MDTLSFLHKRKMKELKGQDRNDYLLENAPLIFAHYREKNQVNKYYRQYLYNINQNQTGVRESLSLNEDNYCNDCQIYKRYKGIKDYNPKLQKTHRKDELVWEKICKELNWTYL